MHMGWMRAICGRLESRYSYAPTIYNIFPWPELTDKVRSDLKKAAEKILEIRDAYPNSSLADLYEPDTMPAPLKKAHQANDKAVDALYRKQGFTSERERVEHLFNLHQQVASPLEAAAARKPKRK